MINITEVEIKDGVITHPAFNLPTSELSLRPQTSRGVAGWSLLLSMRPEDVVPVAER